MKNQKNYEAYLAVLNNLSGANAKGFDFNGVWIETPICDESTCEWFTKAEALKYYGEQKVKSIWTDAELDAMPWRE